MKTHLDLFSGIGGFALAAKWAGFETAAFCEIDPFCQKVLRKNFGENITIHEDIKEFDATQYAGRISLVTGGFPCQPFSIAGKRKGDADPRSLWKEMFRVIRECKPTWVVGENVANFANMGLDSACSDLENEGYEVQSFVIPAVAVGAPHLRKRVFIVAWNTNGGNRNKGSLKEMGKEQNAESTGIRDSKSNSLANTHRGNSSNGRQYQTPTKKGNGREYFTGRSNGDARQESNGWTREGGTNANSKNARTYGGKQLQTKDATESGKRGDFRGRSISDVGSEDISHAQKLLGNGGNHNGEQPRPKVVSEFGDGSRQREPGYNWEETESQLGGVAHGLSRKLDGYWLVEPSIPRVTLETKNRAKRLMGLGNAVVPQQVYPILELISEQLDYGQDN